MCMSNFEEIAETTECLRQIFRSSMNIGHNFCWCRWNIAIDIVLGQQLMSQVSTNLMSLHSPLQFDIHPFDFSFINVFWMCWWDVFTRFLYLSPGRLLVLLGEDDLHIDREEVWMVWIGATITCNAPSIYSKLWTCPKTLPGVLTCHEPNQQLFSLRLWLQY